jgi:hypothetical protein
MLFEMTGDGPPQSIDALAKLIDHGEDAASALPEYT